MDFVFCLIAILLLTPLLLLTTVLLLIQFKGKPFYVQVRTGYKERPFKLLKFRTFDQDKASISSFGKVLRASSLDELPQIFNILSGEMSFVGPRPLLPEYLEYFNDLELQRLQVKPGLTGLAQVKWGNSPDWESRMKSDYDYVSRQSFILDLQILMQTLILFFKWKEKAKQDVEIPRFDEFAQKRT